MEKAFFLGGTQLILGTLGSSVFPTKIYPPAGCVSLRYKLLGNAGSTVHVLPNLMPGFNIAGATNISSIGGYPLVSGEMHIVNGPATFYLAASGSTATVAMLFEYSAHGTTLV